VLACGFAKTKAVFFWGGSSEADPALKAHEHQQKGLPALKVHEHQQQPQDQQQQGFPALKAHQNQKQQKKKRTITLTATAIVMAS
jgi:hypothetical protein